MTDQKQVQQKTFVLGYPCHFTYGSVGTMVTKFEESRLNITELRCMHVTITFAREHLVNIGWDPEAFDDDAPFGKWDSYISSAPVTATIVEGEDSIRKVGDIISKKQLPFWANDKLTVYTSDSGELAEKDIHLWFCPINSDDEVVAGSKKIVYVLPDMVHGPKSQVEKTLQEDPYRDFQPVLKDNFSMETMSVFLIKPLAFQKRCAGKVLDGIEASCDNLRGIKLVRKADCPSELWPVDSDLSDSGIAVVAHIPSLKIMHHDPDSIIINYDNNVYAVGSNYVQQSELGKEVLEHATKFFKSGFSVWAIPGDWGFGGRIFEASLFGQIHQ